MGMFDSLTGGVTNIIGAIEGSRSAKKKRDQANYDLENYYGNVGRQRDVAAMGNYNPTYASQLIGPYKRSESPLERAYLESMLTGDNTQANASPWSGGGQSSAGFDNRFGGYDALLDRGKKERAATPWETKTPGPVDTEALKALGDVNQTPWADSGESIADRRRKLGR